EPFPNLALSDDFQVAAFYQWVFDPEESLTNGLGFQKTWHDGTPDRDLLIWTVDYAPSLSFSLHSAIWGDFFDARDTLEPHAFEISQAIVQPIFRIDPARGVGAHLAYTRWPQLLRNEFSPFVQSQIVGDEVLRYGFFAWQNLTDLLRFDGRVDRWSDQNDVNGTNWETRLSLREALVRNGEVAVALYATEGAYNRGHGTRILLSRRFERCTTSLWYDIANYDFASNAAFSGWGTYPSHLLQQSLRFNLDFNLAWNSTFTWFTDLRFGQRQDAVQAGLFLQKRH
ncbi:MAG: hypothetical protein KDA61_12325, partial [Planctomycetales bacterium]|nr:hypothetical protein [Planctomycetales bacterium]